MFKKRINEKNNCCEFLIIKLFVIRYRFLRSTWIFSIYTIINNFIDVDLWLTFERKLVYQQYFFLKANKQILRTIHNSKVSKYYWNFIRISLHKYFEEIKCILVFIFFPSINFPIRKDADILSTFTAPKID